MNYLSYFTASFFLTLCFYAFSRETEGDTLQAYLFGFGTVAIVFFYIWLLG